MGIDPTSNMPVDRKVACAWAISRARPRRPRPATRSPSASPPRVAVPATAGCAPPGNPTAAAIGNVQPHSRDSGVGIGAIAIASTSTSSTSAIVAGMTREVLRARFRVIAASSIMGG
ncbi:hypothetical protein GCM10023263_55990 [Phytohabitans rumicis]